MARKGNALNSTSINIRRQSLAHRSLMYRMKKYRVLLLMLIPGIVYYFVFHYLPMYGVILAFKDFKLRLGIMGSPWVGFAYFDKMLSSRKFWSVVENTLIISMAKLIFGFFPPIIFAIILNETPGRRFRSVVQTASYLPHFISWVIMAGIIIDLTSLNGPINALVALFGGQRTMWMAQKETFRGLLVITDIWKGFGWASIIYFASLSAIDPQQYEAAAIDGAGRIRRIFYVTLPNLVPIITIQLILSMSGILNAGFDQIFNMTNPAVASVSDIIDTYVYQIGVQDRSYSLSTAIGLFKSIIALVLMLVTNFAAKAINKESYTLW